MKPDFNLEHVYDEQIAPLMSQIIDICKAHELPMFATFLYANDSESEDHRFCSYFLLFNAREIPDELGSLPRIMGLTSRSVPAIRIRTRDKTGAAIKDEVIFP